MPGLPGTMAVLSVRKMTSESCVILSPQAYVGDLCGQGENYVYTGIKHHEAGHEQENANGIPPLFRDHLLNYKETQP